MDHSTDCLEKEEMDDWGISLSGILAKFEETLPDRVRKGAQFVVRTDHDVFDVETSFVDRLGYGDDDIDAKYYMFARNSVGEIVGSRVASISFNEDDREMKVDSFVRVRDRGKHLATPFSLAFMKLLQDIADKNNVTVVLEARNENLKNLEAYAATDHPDPEKLERMRREQQRWQALYGSGGKFGFVDGKKRFFPGRKDQVVMGIRTAIVEKITDGETLFS